MKNNLSNTEHLFQKKTCYINGELKKGKVLAVSTYSNHRTVCFLVEGEKFCIPIEENQFLEQTNTQSKTIAKKKPITNSVSENVNIQEKINYADYVIEKANLDIAYIIKTSQKLYNSVQNSVNNSIEYSENQINNWLNIKFDFSVSVIDIIKKTIVQDFWSLYWKDRIVNSIQNRELSINGIKNAIGSLKKEFPHESNYILSQRLIEEKAIFSTLTGTASLLLETTASPSVSLILRERFSFLKVQPLIKEVIYQIACVYEYETVSEAELLGIYCFSFSYSVLSNINLEQLVKVSDFEINPITNTLLFMVVGYATREFYETKYKTRSNPLCSEQTFNKILKSIEKYAKKILNNRKNIENALSQAIESVNCSVLN